MGSRRRRLSRDCAELNGLSLERALLVLRYRREHGGLRLRGRRRSIGRAARDLSEALAAPLAGVRSLAIGKPNIRNFPVPHPKPSQAEISGGSTRAVHQLFVACVWQRVSFFVALNEFFVDFGI